MQPQGHPAQPPYGPQLPYAPPQTPPAQSAQGTPAQAPGQLPQPPALPAGTTLLDRYLIQGYISGGGFGHIYVALDNKLGYRRAIKEAFYRDPATRYQFQLEAEFLLNMRHPNLVSAYAVFEQFGRLYLVMEYVDGFTLEEIAIAHIRHTGQALPEARVLDDVLPICGALHALHSAPVPIIHRDVKPANIKLDGQGNSILIDLGLAKLYARGTQTIGAALAFTPGYAPPEQYQASGATDARTDVYGMGATLFYLLTGYQPTEAPARLGSMAVPPLRQLNPLISEQTAAVVVRAMELDPDRRQQSALELEQALRAARSALAGGVFGVYAAPGLDKAPDRALVCAACGGANPIIARHCMRCGAALVSGPIPASPPGASGARPTIPPHVLQRSARSADAPSLESPASVEEAWGEDDTLLSAALPPSAPGGASDVASDAPSPAQATGVSGPAWEGPPVNDVPDWLLWSSAPPAPTGPEGAVEAERSSAPLSHMDALTPGPDSVPDQPAIAFPPLRRGPAPVAMRLPASPAPRPGARQYAFEAPALARPARAAAPVIIPARTPAGRAPVGLSLLQLASWQSWLQALPSLRGWHTETLAAIAPRDETEVRVGLAGLLSLVLGIGTLIAVQVHGALVFALPALALGHWCLHARAERPTLEARWLATLGLIITYSWLLLFTVGVVVLALRSGR